MIPEKLKQLILLLTDKTQKKKANWNKVSGNNQFKLSISEGIAITINEWTQDYGGGTVYEVVIFNKNGDAIERYTTDENTSIEELNMLSAFLKAANDQYYKVEETMDALLKSIISQEIIGNTDNDQKSISLDEDDDDLPF